MIKKLGMWCILVALVVQLLPAIGGDGTVSAATGNFTFPTESDVIGSPRITTDERVTLQGTLNNVDPSTISYNVYQIINPDTEQIGSKRENLTSNVSINGFSIQIFNIQLFPGLNKITFKGTQGGGEVSNSIYIEYRNGPMLYDLTASLDGNSFPIVENGTTVVQSNPSRGRSAADISITGKAPNAQQVTIVVNGSSKTYSVNSSNNNTFAAAPITLQKGKNQVTIKVSNGTQVIETTRDIAFYNGSVTFYDVNINEIEGSAVKQSAALEYNPNFVVNGANQLQVSGKVIVPNSYHAEAADPALLLPHPDPITNPNSLSGLKAFIKESTVSTFTEITSSIQDVAVVGSPTKTDSFFIYEYVITLGTGNVLGMDKIHNLKLTARNEVNAHLNLTPTEQGIDTLTFSLRDGTEPFVSEINYLPGYKPNAFEGLVGVPLQGQNIYGLPVGIEVLVGNPSSGTDTINITNIKDLYGNSMTPTAGTDYTVKTLAQPLITKVIDGKLVQFKRFVFEFAKMPYEGTQTIALTVNNLPAKTKSAAFTLLYGPFASFDKAYDGLVIYDDSTKPLTERVTNAITTALGDFKGQLQNINNTNEIRYEAISGSGVGSGPRTVYFYINNVPFELVPVASGNNHDTNFILKANTEQDAFNAMFTGENVIKFVFQSSKSYYEKTVKINIIPTNLPVIPAQASGVYPFSFQENVSNPAPIPNDPKFPKQGSIYTTKEPFMNIYGSFDFIDLGTTLIQVEAKMLQMLAPVSGKVPAEDYILKVTGTSLTDDITWDLSDPFLIVNGNNPVGMYPSNGSINGDLVVTYDLATQSFSFILKRQELNADGSSSVYLFNVYNSGLYGPKATYRLEVDPTILPYKILRPYLPAESVVNKNFVDVIINAKGADKVTFNKVEAEKFEYDANNDGVIDAVNDYPNAFRASITGLKAGKNTIKFTIESASDKVDGSIDITYVPTNIPGAQFLETMKNSHKVFDGALSLSFPKGTALIRRDFNVPSEFKNQVFTDHKILFAIANPEDGVVDRREYDNPPADFDLILQNFGTRFRVSYPSRFTKSSPVFWVDAGLADDLNKAGYDPLPTGVDPYQYPNAKGPGGTAVPTYDERPDNRELIASKRGTLTLAFDPNMRDSIGTIMTVYRYDVKNKFWVNLGGVVDTKKNTVTVPFDQFGYYVVGKMVYSFTDITNHPYARNYMEAIFSKGIMNAANFDDFGADMYTSRGEFTRMVVKSLDVPLNYELSKPHFDDVPPIINPDALWDYSYIETAARNGLIRGTQPRTFEPNSNLTRADAAVFLARALELKLETDPKKIDAALQKTFKDYSDISYYAKASVLAIAKKGYIQGSPVDPADPKKGFVFEPRSNLLRSDAAIIIGKMMADTKRLPKLN